MNVQRPSDHYPAVEKILSIRRPHPVRVAVDGRTASGKTTFADRLAEILHQAHREIIRASIDGFHRPKAVRHRQGRLSPDGYYEDARDLSAVRRLLLDPLGPRGDRCYCTAIFDLEHDQPIEPNFSLATADALLIVDGTFLQRSELRPAWDFVIFLDVPEAEARRRGVARDQHLLGGLKLHPVSTHSATLLRSAAIVWSAIRSTTRILLLRTETEKGAGTEAPTPSLVRQR